MSRVQANGNLDLPEVNELVGILTRLGVQRATAMVIACIYSNGPSTSSDIQRKCKMRQPEVSNAISELRRMEVIEETKMETGKRGRPRVSYSFIGGIEDVLRPIRFNAEQRLYKMQYQVERLNELATELMA